MKIFDSGAVRSTDAEGVRFDAISPQAMRRLAAIHAEGCRKYGVNNFRKGIPQSDLLNHALRHIFLWMEGDRTEDHLAKADWGLQAMMEMEELNPGMCDTYYDSRNPNGPNSIPF